MSPEPSPKRPTREWIGGSLWPRERGGRRLRARIILLVLPTLTVLVVFALIDSVTNQRLLFASLASSAFLIYLDPRHATNRMRTLAIAQLTAAAFGFVTAVTIGHNDLSGAVAMLATITTMELLDAVHPPAIGTALAFAIRSGNESDLGLFGLAVGITIALIDRLD